MRQRADITVFSPDDRLQLVVEVNNKRGATLDWVMNMRRNLLAHSVIPDARFFLLALPDRFYLWKNATSYDLILPDYEIDATPILRAYTDNSKLSLDSLSEYGLELIINSWLNHLLSKDLTKENAQPFEMWLFDSGLYEAIKYGSTKTEALV
jgi:hypothetical protein